MSEQLKQMREIGFVPLVVLEDEADAVPLATALQRGGIPVAEVTFRTEAALSCIEKMAREVPGVLVGAGTVHTVEQAQSAVSAGATFIVTPGFSPKVVSWCVEHQIDVIPGITSPSDVEQAMEFGLPGGRLWRNRNAESAYRSLCGNFFPADRRCKRRKYAGLSGSF